MGRKKEKLANLEDRMLAYVESASDEDKNGRICHVLRAKTMNGPLALRLWDQRARDSFPRVGDFIEIRIGDLAGAKSELSNWWSLSLDSTSNKQVHCGWVPVNEEDVPEGVRKRLRRDRQAQKMRSLEVLKDESAWVDKSLHAFLMGFFKRNVEKFTSVPAAVDNHHTYRGGLFIHTAHVFSLCRGLLNHSLMEFDHVDSDVVYMAAWFHDVGKIEVYSMEGDIPGIDSNRENMFGHIVLGDRIFRREAEAAGLDPGFVDAVSHCILSHHQTKDWGSAVVPLTIEAEILCRADYISSRMPD
jgi:23S rRNA maturation-related 3'-5' exoribonuclease YhaM